MWGRGIVFYQSDRQRHPIVHTVKLLQDSFHGAGAAAAAHGDVELVLVVRHFDSGGAEMLR